ncbi:hypothetical protein YA0729_25305 [Pseudomonas simiae]|uniref:hypothetical protein n=1 Tax=Pseudomonas simiae TaxID=321846 RepID=UPI0018E5BED4|nr:hypothetical protein [Pseudomonas simiae]MBI6616063.1 hypothetical protein [Pseudomonas simiae]
MDNSESLKADLTHATHAMNAAIRSHGQKDDTVDGVVDAFNYLLEVFKNIDARLVALEDRSQK